MSEMTNPSPGRMVEQVEYSPGERFWLWTLAAFGFFTVNGAFVYGLFQPAALAAAMTNPIALAFMGEALVLVGVIAYLLTKWRVCRMSWRWFVILSLLGSMAFALPVVLLWPSGSPGSGASRRRAPLPDARTTTRAG